MEKEDNMLKCKNIHILLDDSVNLAERLLNDLLNFKETSNQLKEMNEKLSENMGVENQQVLL